jgi:hypothetical protein
MPVVAPEYYPLPNLAPVAVSADSLSTVGGLSVPPSWATPTKLTPVSAGQAAAGTSGPLLDRNPCASGYPSHHRWPKCTTPRPIRPRIRPLLQTDTATAPIRGLTLHRHRQLCAFWKLIFFQDYGVAVDRGKVFVFIRHADREHEKPIWIFFGERC